LFSSTPLAPPSLSTLSLHDALPICRILAHQWRPYGRRGPAFNPLIFRHYFPRDGAKRIFQPPTSGLVLGHSLGPLAHFRAGAARSEEHTSELQSPDHLVCRLLLEKK